MGKAFKEAMEQVYRTFAKYPARAKMEGCPCCVSNANRASLHSKHLRDLEAEDLSFFVFKAMTTFGNLEDFKHYLPRILELTVERQLAASTVIHKLEYGNWENWKEEEKQAIRTFVEVWWRDEINDYTYFDPEILKALKIILKNLEQMLSSWSIEPGTQGLQNYLELTEYHYYDLKNRNFTFKDFSTGELEILISWIEEHSVKLREIFFQYEKADPSLSARISKTLSILESNA